MNEVCERVPFFNRGYTKARKKTKLLEAQN